jgi:putative transposase
MMISEVGVPRALRRFEEGRFYHVYNRAGGSSQPLEEEVLARGFVDLLRRVVERDELVILGWCLLGNHYHLVLRQGPVDVSRSMKTVQQGVTRLRNLRDRVYGPLWQGRFKAKEVSETSYLMQVIAYVHLNPVKAGLAEDAGSYRWSGHLDIVGRRRSPIVSVDEVLVMYGETRRQALRSYRLALEDVGDEDWSGERPGRLPWWRLGRPTAEDQLTLRASARDEAGRAPARWRPEYSAADWVDLACAELGVERDALASRARDPRVVWAREVVGLVGIERFGVKVVELARELGKSRGGVTQWYQRGVVQRAEDPEFAAAAKRLESVASEEP